MQVELKDHIRAYFETTHTRHRVPIPTPDEFKGKGTKTNCLGLKAAESDDPLGIFKVCMVGALYSRPLGGLYPRDKQWTTQALQLCTEHGFSVGYNLQLYPCDLQTGRDYIKPKRRLKDIDLVIFCLVRNPSLTEYMTDYDHDEPSLRVSPNHFDNEAFPKALERDRPKAVVTFFEPVREPALLSVERLMCDDYPNPIMKELWVKHRNDPEGSASDLLLCRSLLARQDLLNSIQGKDALRL